MASDPTLKTERSDKPCAQPICHHRRSEHLDGGPRAMITIADFVSARPTCQTRAWWPGGCGRF